jgi:VanZ family protein
VSRDNTSGPSTATRSSSRATPIAVALWLCAAGWAGVIFWFSSKPGSQIPGQYSEVGHLGEYFVFAMLLYWALRASGQRRYAAAVAIAVASLYGVTDEFHQRFVPMRTPDVADWGMDTVGATTGALISLAAAAVSRRAGRASSSPGA